MTKTTERIFSERPFINLAALFVLFCFSIVGQYNDGLITRHWFVPEAEHAAGGFLVASLLSSLSFSTGRIVAGLAVATFFWELTEYSVVSSPYLSEIFKASIKVSEISFTLGDTLLDIFLNFFGAWLFLRWKG